uniref:Unannotated protein n=1 Tax=freshwater metagenome TaxID=449393 RepID=A0A6J7NNM1_9ZZZZ
MTGLQRRGRSRMPSPDRDRGAVLLLAIGFVLLVSAISAALAALVMSSSATGNTLEKVRNRQYAADAAIQDAIIRVRTLERGSPPTCGYTSTLNDVAIRVDCANALGVVGDTDNAVLAQRNVIFEACRDTGSACTEDQIIIRAQINFEQQYGNTVTKTFVQSWSVNR